MSAVEPAVQPVPENRKFLVVVDQTPECQNAQQVLCDLATRIKADAGIAPELVVREGVAAQEILKLVAEDLSIRVLVLGAGTVGANAAKVAAGFGASIALLDTSLERLRYLDDVTPANVDCLYSDRHTIRERLGWADLVIGSVLIPGARAPHLVERDDLKLMKPGAVIIDVAIDQGGCVATSRPTTHADPTYVVDDVVHYCVTNMPGAVGRTSTYALCNATLPYVIDLATGGVAAAAAKSAAIRSAVNVFEGRLVQPAVAAAFGLPCEPFTP